MIYEKNIFFSKTKNFLIKILNRKILFFEKSQNENPRFFENIWVREGPDKRSLIPQNIGKLTFTIISSSRDTDHSEVELGEARSILLKYPGG